MKQFAIGIRSAPYLADHGFQDMVVLPGSLYIEKAIRVGGGRRLRNVRFHSPVILSSDDAVMGLSVDNNGRYTFHDAGGRVLAELESEPGAPGENGNQYGPGFQLVSSIWRRDGECVGRLCLVVRQA